MAAFATMAAAEARAKAKGPAGDNTWIDAHSGRTINGTICVRVKRYMTKVGAGDGSVQGTWIELTDDAAV